ncbi:hypothetical protein FOXG_19894 [Fusarium oxysporum f. sp. lycopersici 4287]|uniref:Uncharacterized protein n=2 Tax=Fusarium oxysporum TaxID=5507 RepID=A0A0J9V9E8_FUSO4|nr:hypothetical protein FOXG_19894 [Fusarium oxysporum f. sp. lycopersici 4287]EXK27843.1 hypothetical protein FOMG_15692 [Fusarium oxysporum f. sp. melonis 26406]KAJ9424282.1 hypothetical protein QL093DRAFT_2098235 [Fusarium oxysporum]KNB07715.1 hypothetical protein FOXG_19894 [Fusarium oxysporum f. sp. lycopersici 4287]
MNRGRRPVVVEEPQPSITQYFGQGYFSALFSLLAGLIFVGERAPRFDELIDVRMLQDTLNGTASGCLILWIIWYEGCFYVGVNFDHCALILSRSSSLDKVVLVAILSTGTCVSKIPETWLNAQSLSVIT